MKKTKPKAKPKAKKKPIRIKTRKVTRRPGSGKTVPKAVARKVKTHVSSVERVQGKTLPQRKAIRQAKLRNIALKRIMEEEGLSRRDAQIYFKRALVDYLFVRPAAKVRANWYELQPGKYYKVKAGKKPAPENVYGHSFTANHVRGIRKLENYWALVHILSDEMGRSIKDTREYIKRRGIQAVAEELGNYAKYPTE